MLFRSAYFISGLLWFPIPVAAGFIALSAAPLDINIFNTNMTGPLVASKVMGGDGGGVGLIAGIVIFIVLFASLASSIDSLLAATSDLITEDIYRKFFGGRDDEKTLSRAAVAVIIGVGLFAWALALFRFNLEQVLFLSGPLVASVIWPVIAGLYWKKANRYATILAMLLGSGVGLYVYFNIGWFAASLVSAAVSMVVVLTGRLFPQEFDWSKLDESNLEIKEEEPPQ